MMETIRSFETSVLIRATRRHIQEDGILQTRIFSLPFDRMRMRGGPVISLTPALKQLVAWYR
jgi:hypothetical protein